MAAQCLQPHLVARVEAVGDCVLVNVQGCQSQGHLVLQLRSESLLDDVVAALDIQVLERHGVGPQQLVGVSRYEGDSEQAAEVVSTRAGGNLEREQVSQSLITNISPIIPCSSRSTKQHDEDTQHY